jgi:hypothetical protein
MSTVPTPFHVGTVVDDLDEAIELHQELGTGPWVQSPWKTGTYFDARQRCLVQARSRVAFGRLSPTMAVELIEPDLTGPVPDAWRRDTGVPTAHIGYWTTDPRAAALDVVARGGKLLLARAVNAEEFEDPPTDPSWLPTGLDTSYLETAAGLLLEFVPASIWESRLPGLFGDQIGEAMPGPSVPSGDTA